MSAWSLAVLLSASPDAGVTRCTSAERDQLITPLATGDFCPGDAYRKALLHLKRLGWAPIASHGPAEGVGSCGQGRDAVCTASFKKGNDTLEFYVSLSTRHELVIGVDVTKL